MKSFLAFMLIAICSNIWSQESFQVLNTVHFGKYETTDGTTVDKITFRLTVVNDGKTKIPDLGVSNRSKLVNFYINGEQSNPVSLYNGLEAIEGEKIIKPGDTAFYEYPWVMTQDAGVIEAYGNEPTIQLEYNGVKSKVIQVNLKNMTVISTAR